MFLLKMIIIWGMSGELFCNCWFYFLYWLLYLWGCLFRDVLLVWFVVNVVFESDVEWKRICVVVLLLLWRCVMCYGMFG